MKNAIYFRHRRKIILPEGTSETDPKYALAFAANIEPYGFCFTPEFAERLCTLENEQLEATHRELSDMLDKFTGGWVKFEPMFPNFPRQVAETPKEKLFSINALHYLGDWLGLRLMPDFVKQQRPAFEDHTELAAIGLGTEEDFESIFRNLISAKSSLSPSDREDLTWFVMNYKRDIAAFLPVPNPHKENFAFFASLLVKYIPEAREYVAKHVKTATDVLRLASAMSGGDASLAQNTKFISFSRADRRFLLDLLENCGELLEDMLRNKKRWIRLGERLHPFEYKGRFPVGAAAFDVLRNNKPSGTFNSEVEKGLAAGATKQVVELLVRRPGEFARRLDLLLRKSDDRASVLAAFQTVAKDVSTNVLLQMLGHFKNRDQSRELRVFFPKGNAAKAYALPNLLQPIDQALQSEVIGTIRSALAARFEQLEPLGAVYLDERLKRFAAPLAQRAASKSLRNIAAGSRLPFPEGNTIRFFLWWKEGVVNGKETGRVDVDLSAVVYDSEWRYLEHISFTNLKSDNFRAFHSGDITSAPEGACEFIDLDIPDALSAGACYAVMSLNSYTVQPYCNLPECFAGWMARSAAQSGEIFEPRTVVNKIDLAAETTIAIPVIMDLARREFIWLDMALTQNPYWYNNIEGNQKGMTLIGKGMTSMSKPSLYDLFEIHARARGTKVESKEEANTVFSLDEGVTPFNTERILAEFI